MARSKAASAEANAKPGSKPKEKPATEPQDGQASSSDMASQASNNVGSQRPARGGAQRRYGKAAVVAVDTPVPDTAAASEPAPARTGPEEGMSQAGDDAAAEGGMSQAADGGKKQRTGELSSTEERAHDDTEAPPSSSPAQAMSRSRRPLALPPKK